MNWFPGHLMELSIYAICFKTMLIGLRATNFSAQQVEVPTCGSKLDMTESLPCSQCGVGLKVNFSMGGKEEISPLLEFLKHI